MTIRAKIKPDAAPPSGLTTGATAQWHQNHQKPRAAVPAKESQSSTLKFDRACNGLNGRGLVFDSTNRYTGRFTLVRLEIAEYIGKEHTDEGDVRWMLEQENMKINPPLHQSWERTPLMWIRRFQCGGIQVCETS